jgi:hypothetical protein
LRSEYDAGVIVLLVKFDRHWFHKTPYLDKNRTPPEEARGFLERLIDDNVKYDDLSKAQLGLLHIIRRSHMYWVKDGCP